jgi:glycosyltransferase involved in cell wall biosynthesis
MKIVYIREFNPFYESGAAACRSAGLLEALMDNDVQIELVITGGFQSPLEKRKKGIVEGYANLNIIYIHSYLQYNIWLRRVYAYVLVYLFQILNDIRLKRIFESDYDVLWLANDNSVFVSFLRNKKYMQKPSFIELNEFNDLHLHGLKLGNNFQYRICAHKNVSFLNAIKEIDLVAVMTKTLRAHYQQLASPEARFIHLPMTVNINRFEKLHACPKGLKKPYIAYTGTFNNQKDGVDILINAFAKLADQYKEYTLYLAGFYHYDMSVNDQLVKGYGLDNRIINVGSLTKDEVPGLLQNASLLVMARPDSRQAKGGFPTKLGEYLATGNPVCVTKVGEIHDYLVDNQSAYFAEPGNVDSFAEAMERALSNPEGARVVGSNGKRIAETIFDTNVQGKRLLDFLSMALQNNNETQIVPNHV